MASTNSQLKNLGVVIGVFAIVGVGIGLTGYLGISDMIGGMGAGGGGSTGGAGGGGGTGGGLGFMALFAALFGFMTMLIAFLLGPVVAAISGLLAGVAFRERGAGALVGGAGSFLGFYVMVILAMLIIAAALPSTGGGGGTGLGSQMSTILKAGIPSGLVGATSGAIGVDFGG